MKVFILSLIVFTSAEFAQDFNSNPTNKSSSNLR